MTASRANLRGVKPVALALEDDLLSGTLLQMVLEQACGKVFVAATAEEALEVFKQVTPDLVLVSWDTDGIDGRTMLMSLRGRVPALLKIPALLMTDREVNARLRLELSMEGYHWILQKPIVMTSLPKLVHWTVAEAQHRPLSGPAQRHISKLFIRCGATASGALGEAVR